MISVTIQTATAIYSSIVVVILYIGLSLMSDSRVTREYYKLDELSEPIHLDKSYNLWANVGTR